ncbi:MAG: ATP-dependent helicase [Ignavibacteriales bacterium]|nr:ATP-dependent helicase [Ignavibacteriales bacterium]MCF8435486.1 ATP-dependent helicase [Ignavibacteriales bacterium]
MAKKYVLKRTGRADLSNRSAPVNFVIDYEHELNRAQYEAAIAENGVFLLIAGAGTGKTRTLVYRLARLVESGYDPSSILLLTFTRKAAREMMNRAAGLLDSRCSKVSGGTFHSFANLTLRKFGSAIGLHNGFTILDQSDSEDIINLIRGQINLGDSKKRFPKKDTIYKSFSLSKNTGIPLEKIIEDIYPHFLEFLPDIIKITDVFEKYKAKNALLDYDDLLIYLSHFLDEGAAVAHRFLKGIEFVMVDEYQDTNKLQSDIVRGLASIKRNIMVVGDDAQSIYSFRGANFKNIINFPKMFPDARMIKLEQNYRSTQTILDFANHIIDSAVEKFPKQLFTNNTSGNLPAIVSATNENMQSRFIVERVLELREEGVPLAEIAVLFRSSYFSFDLEIELNKANIPFVKFGGMKFIETAHVKDIIAFLRVITNVKDLISWYRILLLHEGIGPKKAQLILEEISKYGLTNLVDITKPMLPKVNSDLENLFAFIKKLTGKKALPSDLSGQVYDYYYPHFKSTYDDHNKRHKDLEIFLNISENYNDLQDFLADLALEPPNESVVDISATDKEKEFLTLSTIHSAKGLEWHSVFVIHAVEGFFPSSQSFENLDTMEEERRLMYVAVTRAKQNLYVSYPMNIFDRYRGVTFSKPSRFIAGIDESLAEEWLLEE